MKVAEHNSILQIKSLQTSDQAVWYQYSPVDIDNNACIAMAATVVQRYGEAGTREGEGGVLTCVACLTAVGLSLTTCPLYKAYIVVLAGAIIANGQPVRFCQQSL